MTADEPALRLVEAIHHRALPLVYEFAGAGSLALAWLHSVGGSSRTVLEATDRYSATSLADLLGPHTEKIVSPETASRMAHRAYLRACQLNDMDTPCLGVSCTATIATDRAKRGEHRICVAVCNPYSIETTDIVLSKGGRERAGEEHLAGLLVLNGIARAGSTLTELETLPLLEGEAIDSQVMRNLDPLVLLAFGQCKSVLVVHYLQRSARPQLNGIIFPGSFNPLHYGHQALAGTAARLLASPVTFEISQKNAAKAPLSRAEIERRLAQFGPADRVVVTQAPLFVDKAMLFPGCTFLIGFDTADRVIDPRFYINSETARDTAIAEIRRAGCRFLVAGRQADGSFKTLDSLEIPGTMRDLFIEIPEAQFRADISATALRQLQNPSTMA